jgi:NAD(P)-dependent dehydrogenase (short-subunit alcohol dehydrogenase family)
MAMNITFENQVALVTGAASGLGLATAKAFAESGASVALADWNEKAVCRFSKPKDPFLTTFSKPFPPLG